MEHLLKDDIKLVYDETMNFITDLYSNQIKRINVTKLPRGAFIKGLNFIFSLLTKRLRDKNEDIVQSTINTIIYLAQLETISAEYVIRQMINVMNSEPNPSNVFNREMLGRIEVFIIIIYCRLLLK